MRAALICLTGEAPPLAIAGKTLAQRQLLFALACDCRLIVVHGNGASSEAIRLRHEAEQAGARFQTISSPHALAGMLGSEDSLLVLQPGLLPEARAGLDLLRAEGERILIVSAGPGASAGFERIDLARAWAGALTLPGQWLGRLTALPEDAAPAAALLRIALQQHLPEARLPDQVLDDGGWAVIRSADSAREREKGWLRTHLGDAPAGGVSRWLSHRAIARAGEAVLGSGKTGPILLLLAATLLGGGIAAATFGHPAAAFALVGLAMPAIEGFMAFGRLATAPFGRVRRWPILRRSIDAALLTCGILSIDSLWFRSVFPPFVLVAGLLLLDRRGAAGWVEPLRDRLVVALALAGGCAILTPETAMMIAAAAILAASLAPAGRDGG